MQADPLAEFGQANAFAVTGDLFQNRKGAAERLHAAALAVLSVVVDIRLARWHEAGDRGLARGSGLFARLRLGARFHDSGLPVDGAGL